MSSKFSFLLLLLIGGHLWAQPNSNSPAKVIEVPIVIPSVSELVDNQKRKATTEYVRKLNLDDPDIDKDGKVKLPELMPRVAFAVRYLMGTPEQLQAMVEIQGVLRKLQSGDKLAGFDVRVTTQGVSLFLTRKGNKEGWTEPLSPGFYQEYF